MKYAIYRKGVHKCLLNTEILVGKCRLRPLWDTYFLCWRLNPGPCATKHILHYPATALALLVFIYQTGEDKTVSCTPLARLRENEHSHMWLVETQSRWPLWRGLDYVTEHTNAQTLDTHTALLGISPSKTLHFFKGTAWVMFRIQGGFDFNSDTLQIEWHISHRHSMKWSQGPLNPNQRGGR